MDMQTQMSYRTAYYARVSTEEEKQLNALQGQIEYLEEFISKKPEWTFVRGYVDEGKSGTQTKTRYSYRQMVADIQADKLDVIVMKRLDRGWRKDWDWSSFEQLIITTGKLLYITENGRYYNYRNTSEWMMTGIDSKFSEWYARKLSDTLNLSFSRGKAHGKPYGNVNMWGYDYHGNFKYTINEREAEMVRYVFKRYIEGAGFRRIADELYVMGYYPRGTNDTFPLTTLKRIIRQTRYMGVHFVNKTSTDFLTHKQKMKPKEEWVKAETSYFPPIISQETFDKANEVLASKKQNINDDDKVKVYGRFSGTYALSGKIKCAKCGKTYHHNSYSKPGVKSVWLCSSYKAHGKKGCDNKCIPVDALDDIVKRAIYSLWETREETFSAVIRSLDVALDKNDDGETLKQLTKQLDRANELKKKMRSKLYRGLITEKEYKEDSIEIDADIERLTNQINVISNRQSIIDDKKARLDAIKTILSEQITGIDSINDDTVKELVREIIIDGYNITVYLDGDITIGDTYTPMRRRKIEQNAPQNQSQDVSSIRSHGHTGGSGSGGV